MINFLSDSHTKKKTKQFYKELLLNKVTVSAISLTTF